MLIMYLLTDIMKNGTIEKGSMTNEEYQIVQKKQQELLASKITNEAIKLTQNNDFIFDDSLEIIRRYCSGDLELATMNNSPLIEKR